MPHPFRADHIGSLIRPGYLTDVQKAISDGMHMHNLDISKADADLVQRMKDAEKKAISDAVGEQVKRGISPITSGEMERPSFVSGFFESLEGMEIQFKKIADFKTGHPIMRPYLQAGAPGREQPIATGKVKFKRSAYMDELKYVQSLVPADLQKEIKITIPSPSWSHTQLKEGEAYTKDAYADASEYLKDIAEAMRQEILSLYDAGLRFVQIDDPMLAMMVDEEYLELQAAEGTDLDALLDPSVMAHNAVLRDLPSDLTVAMHLCRGNLPKGMKAAVGGYHKMASKMFKEMNYKRFALEYDNDLVTGDFTPLQHLPPDKICVLGLVTTKDSELEDVAALKKQVFDAADLVAKAQGKSRDEALEDLAVSPGCGFSSAALLVGTGMSQEIQWEKLELVKELALEIWSSS